MAANSPICSVVVPAYNAAQVLPKSLGALVTSDLKRDQWELIVVDDGSTDDTADLAARYADSVVRLRDRPHGPAYARNRGVELATGDIIIFVDADVVVHPDTIRRLVEILDQDATLGAVFGSYDTQPPAPGLMSQYRNLLHHYVHTLNAGPVETFWAGAGAVRRDLFVRVGMYDEWHFARPQIEDIELGARLRSTGAGIALRSEVQVTHLKRWTFWGVVRTDMLDRGIPWARLLAHRGTVLSTSTLNLRKREKILTALVWISLISMSLAALTRRSVFLIPAVICLILAFLMLIPVWRFFVRERGLFFTVRIAPVHLLYYLLNGISFGVGLFLQQVIGPPLRDPTTDAYAEIGVKRWPPVPSRDRPSSWTEHK
jgi:glycosyltransferase involved in cell wall biosynthesis